MTEDNRPIFGDDIVEMWCIPIYSKKLELYRGRTIGGAFYTEYQQTRSGKWGRIACIIGKSAFVLREDAQARIVADIKAAIAFNKKQLKGLECQLAKEEAR
jgi:tellurite resistance-related uncharacterized protein